MGENDPPTGLLGHCYRFQSFGEGSDLVWFDEHGVARPLFQAPAQALDIGNKEIVPHQLHPAPQGGGQLLPSLPVILPHAVLQGYQRIAQRQVLPKGGQLGGCKWTLTFGCEIQLPFRLPLAGGGVNGQGDIPPRLISRLLHRLDDQLQRFLVRGEIGGKASLIPHAGAQPPLPQQPSQGVVDFAAPPQSLPKGWGPVRTDHKLLDIHIVCGVGSAVENVHHRHRQHRRRFFRQIPVQGLLGGLGRGSGNSQGHRQDAVGAQMLLVSGAVRLHHGLIHRFLFPGVQAPDGGVQYLLYLSCRLLDSLTSIAGRVPIPQLMGLMDPCGGSRGGRRFSPGSAFQSDPRLDGGVSPAVQNLQRRHLRNGKIFHGSTPSHRRRSGGRPSVVRLDDFC